MFPFSRSVLSTISPPIPAAYKWTTKSHRQLLDMSQGVPGTPPHPMLQQALAQIGNAWGYCPAEGEPALREALAKEMRSIYGLTKGDENVDITSSDIAITSGCNLAFVAAIMAIADAGDEVILPVPWYFNHQMTLTLLGMQPVPLSTSASDGFLPSPSLAAQLINPGKTRAIALVTPNNPTGAVYPPELLQEFANLAREKGIALILDETYRDFIIPESAPHSLFNKTPSDSSSWRSHVISLYSFSKSYRIPSHRLGAITASPTLLTQIGKILDTLQICAPRPPQIALASLVPSNSPDPSGESIPLLSLLHQDILFTSQAIHLRHALFKSALTTEAPKWKIASQGAYYAFVQHPFPGRSSEEVCQRLVEEVGVRVLPVAFFGGDSNRKVDGEQDSDADRYIRFSVANIDDNSVVGVCQRLAEAESAFRDWTV
ncbi:PLP-dependent transferase [Gymnopus androsaceus JB14]|uniref:PLP-dependent transferase n=1 Tax=Gymnopus androsaceus JB14 TaxID=1447944 RepID=A0A6A4HVU9_9AGAR|nr:PLP-dependent transferase [Gymnopus androsaceus JB14]